MSELKSSNLVARLRAKAAKGGVIPIHDMTIEEAADEIERLRRELEGTKHRLSINRQDATRLHEALKRIRDGNPYGSPCDCIAISREALTEMSIGIDKP